MISMHSRISRSCFLCLALLALFIFMTGRAQARNMAFLVGISQYQYLPGAKYCDEDVKTFKDYLLNFTHYQSGDIQTLTNNQATRSRILSDLARFASRTKGRQVENALVMFAGHGVNPEWFSGSSQDYFLIPNDGNVHFKQNTSRASSASGLITKRELASALAKIDANNVVLIIDACHSGVRSFPQIYSVEVQRNRNDDTRVGFLAAAGENQEAMAYSDLKHGAMSYCLLKIMEETSMGIPVTKNKQLDLASVYRTVQKLFRTTRVMDDETRKMIYMSEKHEPLLFTMPQPAMGARIRFVNIRGQQKTTSGFGELALESSPTNLEVEIDGKKTSYKTNCRIRLPDGKHKVTLEVPDTGFRHTFIVDIAPGGRTTRHVNMQGELHLKTFWERDGDIERGEGPKVDIFLNNNLVVKGKSIFSLKNLPAGTHTMKIAFGNTSKERSVEIRPDSPLTAKYIFVRKAGAMPKEEKKVKRLRSLPI